MNIKVNPLFLSNNTEDNSLRMIVVSGGSASAYAYPQAGSVSGQVRRLSNTVSGRVAISVQSELSMFTNEDQLTFDSVLNGNFDMISTNVLFEKIKDYEQKYKKPSEEFYKNWIKGEVITTPEIYNWMTTYKTLFKQDKLWQVEKAN